MTNIQNERTQHYVRLCEQSTTAEQAMKICIDCTTDIHLFVFSEILATSIIRSLDSSPNEKYYQLLQLFAHGTIPDYFLSNNKTSHSVPTLNEEQIHKLRLLTLVTLSDGKSLIPYSNLKACLKFKNDEHVEQIIRDAISAGLIRGKMNQKLKVLQVSSTVGRDIIIDRNIAKMNDVLKFWLNRTDQLVAVLDDRIAFVGQQTRLATQHQQQALANVTAARQKLSNATGTSGNNRGDEYIAEDDAGESAAMQMMMGDVYDEIIPIHQGRRRHEGSNASDRRSSLIGMGRSPRRTMSRPSDLSRYES